MKTWTLWVIACAAMAGPLALAQDASTLAAIRAACAGDAAKLCAGIQPGGGRVIACLKEHKDALSDQCKQAAAQAANANNQLAPGSTPAPPSTQPSTAGSVPSSPSTTASTAPTAAGSGVAPPAVVTHAPAKSHTASTTGASASQDSTTGRYLRMKQVQIIARIKDDALSPDMVDMPTLDMLIPSDWTLTGSMEFNKSEGCFIDLYAAVWAAKSPDGTIAFFGAPNTSWQYADDPAELRKLADPARRALGGNGKPCPIGKPLSAEDYFRQKIATAFKSTDVVVAVEPFPELTQMARMQMGLPADQSTDRSGTRVEAIRARMDSGKDEHPAEGWVALAVVTRVFRQGRGAFYDSRAIDIMSLRTPKGKLDSHDKLFKVMVSSLRTEPKWQSYSGGTIANLYRMEAQKEAVIDATIANFQAYAAQTIMDVTANQMRGANNSAFAADQNIRGVQTFRDPTTGHTMELSNLYDHAWLNSSNEYIMSEDPNFNPNGQLTGQWNQLQAVRPAP
jgi:hypothetical protein